LQLVLLSIIIVGQNIMAAAADKRSEDTYQDADATLHEAAEIQKHLLVQDRVLTGLTDKVAKLTEHMASLIATAKKRNRITIEGLCKDSHQHTQGVIAEKQHKSHKHPCRLA